MKDIVIKDEIEDILEASIEITHISTNPIPRTGDTAKQIPRYVEIPFPPLNFSQTGKLWPKKEKSAAKANNCELKPKIITGKAPFRASRARVIIAKLFEPDLNTFVAPIFPDPSFVISILLKYFVSI